MFEAYFNLVNTPFRRDISVEALYIPTSHQELYGRLEYACRNKMFAVVTGDVGTGKSTAIRRLCSMLDVNKYKVMYISDSALTPRNFYWEALNQLGCEPKFYRGDAKRQLQRELMALVDVNKKIPVIIVDEAHLLSREMLEEIRFLLNFKMDSYNPLSLILIGQSELKDILKLQIYEAIAQRINVRYHLPAFEHDEILKYIQNHLDYAGAVAPIFTDAALEVICKYTGGIARKINNICTSCLMHAVTEQKRLIDDHMVETVIVNEFEW